MGRLASLSPVLWVSLMGCGPTPASPPAPVTPATPVAAKTATPATPVTPATPAVAAAPRPDTAGWTSFEEKDRFGFKDAKGQVVLPARYEVVQEFTPGGVACVVDGGAWVCIDGRGAEVVRPFIFDNGPDGFAEGLARFVEGDKLGFFDESGARVIPARLDFARGFAGGRAAFCAGCTRKCEAGGEHCDMVGGKWGLIDKTGKEVVAPRFDQIGDVEAGVAEAVLAGKPVRIDADGQPVPAAK